jgi:hypothetical protein
MKPGIAVDVFDGTSGRWWQGMVKKVESGLDPLILIAFKETLLPESKLSSECKLVSCYKSEYVHLIS